MTTDNRVLVQDAEYDESMETVVGRVFDEFPLDVKGRKVLVKPNMLSPFSPDDGVTTHPTMVRNVVQRLKADGAAEVIVGDSPGLEGYGDSNKASVATGIAEASEGCYVNLGRKPVRHPIKSKYTDYVMIAGDVLEADLVVNLPKFKTHGLTTLTGALKNTFGYVLGGDKMRIHSKATTPTRFAEALLDIHDIKRPALNIMDAVVAMEGNGPTKGTLRKIGKVMAAYNAATLDAAAVHMIGRRNKDVPCVELAGQRGIGETDMSRITISGDMPTIRDFKLPSTFVPGIMGVILNRFLSRWINCVPEVMDDVCVGCGICVEHCPVEAMEMGEDHPHADLDKCIHCYCCQEMCPEGAIRLTGRLIQRVRRMYNPQFHRDGA